MNATKSDAYPIISVISQHTAMIEAKRQRGLLRRILEASGDGKEVVKAFRDISFHIDVFIVRINYFHRS